MSSPVQSAVSPVFEDSRHAGDERPSQGRAPARTISGGAPDEPYHFVGEIVLLVVGQVGAVHQIDLVRAVGDQTAGVFNIVAEAHRGQLRLQGIRQLPAAGKQLVDDVFQDAAALLGEDPDAARAVIGGGGLLRAVMVMAS